MEDCLAATGSTPNTPVWDVATGKLVRVLRGGGTHGGAAIAFSVDNVVLALAGGEGTVGFVRLYDLRTGAIAGRMVARALSWTSTSALTESWWLRPVSQATSPAGRLQGGSSSR